MKPALIEIEVNQKGELYIEARVSIEALLTGINSQYKNTKDAPKADEYDVLRQMEPKLLQQEFSNFYTRFLSQISLKTSEGEELKLHIIDVYIPETGYTKVPRISVIMLKSKLRQNKTSLVWYYPALFGDNAVRLKQVDDAKQEYHWSEWQWLRGDKSSKPFSLTEVVAKKSLYNIISDYIVVGFQHIVPKGVDHVLFILGLFFFSAAIKPLILQVTMFTVAHTLTFGLSMQGFIQLPANIVEPLIALSIVYIGVENILSKQLKMSRLCLVFLFGLIHGLGFASVLNDFDLPRQDFLIAIFSFNVGVEIAQLAIIFILYFLVGRYMANKTWYRASVSNPASLIIALIGLCWFIQRIDLNFL